MPEPAASTATPSVRTDEGPVDRSLPYPSCDWLEAGLAFNRRSLHACLIVHHGRGFPKLCDFNGGEVPWEEVAEARRSIIRRNQRGGHPDCAGCPNLTTRMWPEPAHDVQLVGVAQFVRCNIYCDYCFLQTQDPESFKDGLDPYTVEPAIDALIRDGRLAPDVTFDWGGGEPTIYPEFDSMLRKVTEYGGTTWVHTNASRFPKPLAEGMPADRVGIICSVDAGFPESYLRMKGRDYLERVWANLTRFLEAGCQVHLKYIVKDANCSPDELRAFVARAAQIGAKSLIVDLDYNFPNPSKEVLAGVVLLRRLAQLYGMQTSFGATGAQVLPELDEGRRAWEGADDEVPEPPGEVEWDLPVWEVAVRSSLTGECLEATIEGGVARTEGGGGRFVITGPQEGDTVTVKAFAHAPTVFRVGSGCSEILLSPVRVLPDDVFDLLNGFGFAEVPETDEGGLSRFDAAFESDGLERSQAATAARFLLHQSLVATLLVISIEPAAMLGCDRLRSLAEGFAAATGCEPESLTIDGERLYSGHPSDRLTWIALARHSVLFVVLAEDAAFADGVARSVLKQIR